MSDFVLPLETLSLAAIDVLETMLELDEFADIHYTTMRLLGIRPELESHGLAEIYDGLSQLERLGYISGLDNADGRGLPSYSYIHCGRVIGRAAITRDRQRHQAAAASRQAALRAPRRRMSALAAKAGVG